MDFVWDNPGELVPEEAFTHLHLHSLSPSFLWSASWPGTFHSVAMQHYLVPVWKPGK